MEGPQKIKLLHPRLGDPCERAAKKIVRARESDVTLSPTNAKSSQEVTPTWLPTHDPNKDDINRPAKVDVRDAGTKQHVSQDT